uniref:Uncharacterized protein n=1 Tax=Sphaerodactylus townsendi TaxID=933632 RepID=A0ACB8G675_9SAUR
MHALLRFIELFFKKILSVKCGIDSCSSALAFISGRFYRQYPAALASASCDGSVRVWKIAEQICEKSWPLLQKCNDVIDAKSICRLAWQPKTGKLLAIPVEKVVKLYRRETWEHQFDLSDDFITQLPSMLYPVPHLQ